MSSWCPLCDDWPLTAGDSFCGGCGAFIAPVSVAFSLGETRDGDPSLALIGDDAGLPVKVGVFDVTTGHRLEGHDIVLDELDGETALVDSSRRLRHRQPLALAIRALTGDGAAAANNLAVFSADKRSPVIRAVVGDLDADILEVGSGGATIGVLITNSGGAIVLSGARLRLDSSVGQIVNGPELRRPVLITGDPVKVSAWLAPDEAVLVANLRGGIDATLDLRTSSGDKLPQIRLRISRQSPAKVEFEVEQQIVAGMTGRRARLAARLYNSGGLSLAVTKISAQFGENEPELLDVPLGWYDGVEPGGECFAELRPALSVCGVPLPPGLHDCRIEIICRSAGTGRSMTEARIARLRVHPEREFTGRICVDFGTTESAAAAIAGPGPVGGDGGALPEPPVIIELRQIGLSGYPDSARRFLRTMAVTYGPEKLVGEAATKAIRDSEQVETEAHKRAKTGAVAAGANSPVVEIKIHPDLKWTPEKHDLRVAYLSHVKALIEDHPAVAAKISSAGGGVDAEHYIENAPLNFASQPTVFDAARRERLRAAFIEAGFGDPSTKLFRKPASLIAESWPPVPYVLIDDDRLFRNLIGKDRLLNRPVLKLAAGEIGYVLIYDVGGGSADMSVLEIRTQPGGTHIRSLRKYTDDHFVGREFEALIERCLLAYVAPGTSRAKARGFESANLWQSAVERIQHAPGLFSDFENELRAHFKALLDGKTLPDDAKPITAEIGRALGHNPADRTPEAEATRRAVSKYLPLRLPLDDGSTIEIDIDALPVLLGTIVEAFGAEYVAHVEVFTKELITGTGVMDIRNADADDDNLRIVPSGRGARSPLADALLAVLWEGFGATMRMFPLEAKSVTSWGGLWLADLVSWGAALIIDPDPDEETEVFAISRGKLFGALEPLPMQVAGHDPRLAAVDAAELPDMAVTHGRVEIVAKSRSGPLRRISVVTVSEERERRKGQWIIARAWPNGREDAWLVDAENIEAAFVAAEGRP